MMLRPSNMLPKVNAALPHDDGVVAGRDLHRHVHSTEIFQFRVKMQKLLLHMRYPCKKVVDTW